MTHSVPEGDYLAQINDWRARLPATDWRRQIEALRVRMDGSLALDCGCGPGHYGPILSEMNARVIGVDRESKCLNLASQAYPAYSALVKGDLINLPFSEGIFDVALLRYVLHHVPDSRKLQALKDLRRTIKSGGHLIIETAFGDQIVQHFDHELYRPLAAATTSMYPSRRLVRSLAVAAGFIVANVVQTTQKREPYATVEAALEKSQRLVEMGEGPTAWLRLSLEQRREFHAARVDALPLLFGAGPVPRIWRGSFVVLRVLDV